MEWVYEKNRIYIKDESNQVIAEVTFPDLDEQTVNINHTFVDDSLRGQGVAGKLMEAAGSLLRKQKRKAVLTCSYAVNWFDNHPEYHDILVNK